ARTAIFQQNQVLSIAAHDLKNPLTTITAWADLARQFKNDPDQVEDMCDRIRKSADKMNRLVNDLLESARKEANKVQVRPKDLDLAVIIDSVVKANEVLASNKIISLYLNILSKPMITGDEDRITELADNLVNNAIKYSPYGKNVFVTLTSDTKNAILEVRDEGQGLTEEDKQNLFQRFVTLSAQPTGGETSTGLGLSIVKTFVEVHGGEIIVQSDGKNTGATFIVKLPLIK
ncbi:MAG: HAMP domain-containing sensor histidine kinase, partial [Bacteroidia bacterium]